mmetsp:Transcript_123047/g.353526  ORF Transcript_123047/g.353526 Transcript_123047/m.353526 type:complete len:231 (+) Transcript_123047:173-865(+)
MGGVPRGVRQDPVDIVECLRVMRPVGLAHRGGVVRHAHAGVRRAPGDTVLHQVHDTPRRGSRRARRNARPIGGQVALEVSLRLPAEAPGHLRVGRTGDLRAGLCLGLVPLSFHHPLLVPRHLEEGCVHVDKALRLLHLPRPGQGGLPRVHGSARRPRLVGMPSAAHELWRREACVEGHGGHGNRLAGRALQLNRPGHAGGGKRHEVLRGHDLLRPGLCHALVRTGRSAGG